MDTEPAEGIRAFLEDSRVVLHLRVDRDGRVVRVNRAFAALVGAAPDALRGRGLDTLLDAGDADAGTFDADVRTAGDGVVALRFRRIPDANGAELIGERADGAGDPAIPALTRLNDELAVLSREHARRGRELQAALDEIDRSYWHLKKIQEVLPICMDCGRVKTGDASWESVVDYLKKNSLFLSHGYCPECTTRARTELRLRGTNE